MEKGPVFGLSIGELLTIYDRDSRSWKMSECLFTGDYARYSAPLPKSGIMLNGRIYEQATWAPRTGGKESGLWPTPDTQNHRDGNVIRKDCNIEDGGRHGVSLHHAVMWPTTHSNCHTGAGKRGDGGENLQTAVKWPTPVASGKLNGGTRDFKILQNLADCGQITEYERRSMSAGNGGQLNPTWVDWLMGYPIGWTDCADSETRLSLK